MPRCEECLHFDLCNAFELNGIPKINASLCGCYKNATDDVPQSEWISVDERLPDEEGKYLVVLEGRIAIQRFNPLDGINKMWWESYISHWMPIPELPKMKGAES